MARELGIIMCPESVQAAKQGRKTQTRRIERLKILNDDPDSWSFTGWVAMNGAAQFCRNGVYLQIKPRYQVGDLLWAKETHARWSNDSSSIIYCDDPEFASLGKQNVSLNKLRASAKTADLMEPVGYWQKVPSRYMPKKDARLWVRVTAVKDPHQIQNISEKDAEKEGVRSLIVFTNSDDLSKPNGLYTVPFSILWDRLHPKPGERWEDSPWVFPYVFERIER